MVYKIGLISTHGTGKTTLAYMATAEFKKRGIKAKPLTEVAAEASETGIPINKNTTLEAQAWILHRQFCLELEAEIRGYSVIICDRTAIDNYVYLENACGENKFYLDMVLGHIKEHPYSKSYLLPLVGELQKDGIRDSDDKEFQKTIYFKLEQKLEQFKIPFELLPKPKPNDVYRKEWINMIVSNTLKDLESKKSTENP